MVNYSAGPPGSSDNNFIEEDIFYVDHVEEPPFVYDDPGLPPGIASEIPEHVYCFEKAWQDSKMICIYELLKKPHFLPLKDLDEKTVHVELKRLMELMEENQISLEIPVGKAPGDVYRFITEFLFIQEIDDLKLEGLSRYFIYNEDYGRE